MQANPTRRSLCTNLAVQRAVMALSLATYPHWRTTLELRREIGCGRLVKEAVRALVGIGLIERRGVSVRPTLAAAHFERLALP